MRTLDVATRVKRQFGDESGSQITDAVILDWINDAQREIVNRNKEILQKKATMATVNGTANYALPTEIIRLHRVAYKGIALNPISIQAAEQDYPDKDLTPIPTGTPLEYWFFNNEINLRPAPATSSAADLTLYYERYPTDASAIAGTDPTGTIDLPLQYHQRVVEYCIAQAAELDDNDSRYATKMAQFNSSLDDAQSDSFIRNQNVYPSIQIAEEDSSYYAT